MSPIIAVPHTNEEPFLHQSLAFCCFPSGLDEKWLLEFPQACEGKKLSHKGLQTVAKAFRSLSALAVSSCSWPGDFIHREFKAVGAGISHSQAGCLADSLCPRQALQKDKACTACDWQPGMLAKIRSKCEGEPNVFKQDSHLSCSFQKPLES